MKCVYIYWQLCYAKINTKGVKILKIAVITGASSGLGKEFFLQLENEYDEVWMIARREEKMKAISELRPEIKAKIVKLDLLKKEAFHLFDELLTQNDADIRLLINNAGYGLLGDFDEMETDGQTGIVRLNNEALVGMTSVALKHMHDGAQIINICSIASFVPNTRMAVYSSSKAFVMSFSRALRGELRHRRINCLAVCPGPMDTEFLECAGIEEGSSRAFDMLPYCNAKDVAKKALVYSKKGKAVYTPKVFYKFYRVVAKLLPTGFVMRMAKT